MAAGLDLAFVGCEIGLLAAATERVRKEIAGYCRWSIGGTMLVSAGLNGLAFGAAATDWYMYPAVGLGVSVPGLIYLLSRVSFTLASRRSKPRRSDPGGFSFFAAWGVRSVSIESNGAPRRCCHVNHLNIMSPEFVPLVDALCYAHVR